MNLSPEHVALVPIVCAWSAEMEAQALQSGKPLDEALLGDARTIGLTQPERVRVLQVGVCPSPSNPALRTALLSVGIDYSRSDAVTPGHGVFVRTGCGRNMRELLLHELVHVMQFERAGSREALVWDHAQQLVSHGYHGAQFELEARRIAHQQLNDRPAFTTSRPSVEQSIATPVCEFDRKEVSAKYSEYIGIPFKGGGRDQSGADCFGIVDLFLRQEFGHLSMNIESPPNSTAMHQIAKRYVRFMAKNPMFTGDICFFRCKESGLIRHLAIYLGGDNYLHTVQGCSSQINPLALIERTGLKLLGVITPDNNVGGRSAERRVRPGPSGFQVRDEVSL